MSNSRSRSSGMHRPPASGPGIPAPDPNWSSWHVAPSGCCNSMLRRSSSPPAATLNPTEPNRSLRGHVVLLLVSGKLTFHLMWGLPSSSPIRRSDSTFGTLHPPQRNAILTETQESASVRRRGPKSSNAVNECSWMHGDQPTSGRRRPGFDLMPSSRLSALLLECQSQNCLNIAEHHVGLPVRS